MEVADQAQKWMQQWRLAAVALAQVRRRALQEMDDGAALAAAERVLAAGVPTPPRRAVLSGLVEQQRLLHRHRP